MAAACATPHGVTFQKTLDVILLSREDLKSNLWITECL